jgi:aerobic-type carbon monoxide dehydrogenase small subunit (CoxS/CutS family)
MVRSNRVSLPSRINCFGHPNLVDADIDEAMAVNLCRCATYFRIRNAIHHAARGKHS